MAKSLDNEKELTLQQRAYVLGVEPMKYTPKLLLTTAIFLTLYVFSATVMVASGLSPESVPRWAYNLGKFMPWLVALSAVLSIVVGGGMAAFIAISGAAAHDDSQPTAKQAKFQDDFYKLIEQRVKTFRPHPVKQVSNWVTRISLACLEVGLIMNGFVFLPILLLTLWGGGWVAWQCDRACVIKAIKQIVPGVEVVDKVIDVTPRRDRTIDTGLDLSTYQKSHMI